MLYILVFTRDFYHFDCCMRFDVARSTMQGNAKASIRGTSDR